MSPKTKQFENQLRDRVVNKSPEGRFVAGVKLTSI